MSLKLIIGGFINSFYSRFELWCPIYKDFRQSPFQIAINSKLSFIDKEGNITSSMQVICWYIFWPSLLRYPDMWHFWYHYNTVIMGAIASQITSLTTVYSILYSDADETKHQSYAPLAFVRGIHRGPVNSPHKWPVTRKMFPFDDVILMELACRKTH